MEWKISSGLQKKNDHREQDLNVFELDVLLLKATIIHKIFENNSSFQVK